MPHGLLKNFKSNLPKFLAQQLGAIQAVIISKVNQKIDEMIKELLNRCPPPEVLEKMTKTLSTLKTLINSFDKKITNLKKVPDNLDKPIAAGKVVVSILSHLFIPSTIGTRPGPQGGVVASQTMGKIQSNANKLAFTNNMINGLSDEQKAMRSLFGGVDGVLSPLKARIAQIESLIQKCASNPDLSDDDRRKILAASGNTGYDNSLVKELYTSTNGAVYSIKIISSSEDGLVAPRRQAIAIDRRGVTILKGPLSFASEPQVLIDELKLRLEAVLNPPINTEDSLIITTAPKAPTPTQTAPPPLPPPPPPAPEFVYNLSGLDLSFKTFLREKGYKDYIRTGLFQRKRAKTMKRASDKEKREYSIWKRQKEETEKEVQRAQQILNNLNLNT
jgi:hypothetical protein